MNIAWDHWHIEVSSICTLKCPRCPRAEVPESLLNTSLNLDFFQNNISANVVRHMKKITFCGNDGDPIYCKSFLEICAWLKSVNPSLQLVIVTNGSYKSAEWWDSLGSTLNEHDEIHWSIDGWDQKSNEQYRVNCDWNSIVEGILAFRQANQTSYRLWASIAFAFNENHLQRLQDLAKLWQFDAFQLTKSTKFSLKYPEIYNSQDNLQPKNKDLIALGDRFQREVVELSDKVRPGSDLKQMYKNRAKNLITSTKAFGLCHIGAKGVFLNSRGEFYPCCWVATRYEHNQQWQTLAKNKFNLYHNSVESVVNDQFWQTEFMKFDTLECRTKCTKNKLTDLEYVSEW